MLRVNLLPPYIYEKQKVRNAAILWGVILILVIVGVVYWNTKLTQADQNWQSKTAALQGDVNQVNQDTTETNTITSQIASTKSQWQFVNSALSFNTTYPSIYKNLRDYTPNQTLIRSISIPDGTNVTVNGFAPSLWQVAHFWLAMYRDPNITNLGMSIDHTPGYPAAAAAGNRNQLFGAMGGGYGGAQMMSSGFPGMPSAGFPIGPMMSGGGMMSSAGGPTFNSAGLPTFGGMTAPSSVMGMGMPGMSKMGGYLGAPSNRNMVSGAMPPGGGHEFTFTAQLINPVAAAPSWPPAAASTSSQGGGFGGMGGMGGMGGPPMAGMPTGAMRRAGGAGAIPTPGGIQ